MNNTQYTNIDRLTKQSEDCKKPKLLKESKEKSYNYCNCSKCTFRL